MQIDEIRRVVVRGANWVGDAVMTVPALIELRRVLPCAHITLATRAWAEGIFADADFIDDLMITDAPTRGVRRFFRQAKEWRKRRFDCAVLFPNAFEPALLAFAARIPLRTGYATDGRRPLLTHPLDVPTWRGRRHEVFYYLNIISELEQHLTGATHVNFDQTQLRLGVSGAREATAHELLRRVGVTFQRPLVALCPGSTNSRAKRWPSANYAALADRLIEEAGADCILIGAREELDVTREVAARMRRQPVVLTGETSLAETVAVLGLVDLLVTNDTGPAHIAAALARPTLVIFGPTDPTTTRPFSHVAEVIRHPPVCAPCMLRDCPIDHRCMTAITPAEIFVRAVEILERHPAFATQQATGAEVVR
ncbi:MAG TPA: lipopolysaccharide heptosyltransferase II [Pyrinomonadaceae bacterium]|jgi:heptosyltransferase-2